MFYCVSGTNIPRENLVKESLTTHNFSDLNDSLRCALCNTESLIATLKLSNLIHGRPTVCVVHPNYSPLTT